MLNWTTESTPPGKSVHSKLAKYWPETLKNRQLKMPLVAKPLAVNFRWLSTPARSTCALGAGAALALGSLVAGAAHSATEDSLLVDRTSVVSELAPETAPAEPPAENGQEPAAPVEAAPAEAEPAEPEPAAPTPSVPLDERRVTSPFGWRENPLLGNGALEWHTGIDFGATLGTPVKATSPGTVTYAEYHQYGGLRVVVDHGNGVETTYNHLNEISVEVGQWVDFNQQVGTVGSTGNSTGPHLHFEVLRNGEYQDPAVELGL